MNVIDEYIYMRPDNYIRWLASKMYAEYNNNRRGGHVIAHSHTLRKHGFCNKFRYWLAVADVVNSRKLPEFDARRIVEQSILDYIKWYPRESTNTILNMVVDNRESV